MNASNNFQTPAAQFSMGAPVHINTSVTVFRRSAPTVAIPASQRRPTLAVRESVELTVGIDPQSLVKRCVASVRYPALRSFIASVMAERDVNRVLTMLPGESVRYARWPIDRVRSCAEVVSLRSALPASQREILFVAALIAGIEVLLEPCVVYPATTADVMRSIVRSALHNLDHASPAVACALRNCLGWGNEDDMDSETLAVMQQAVRSAAAKLRRSLV